MIALAVYPLCIGSCAPDVFGEVMGVFKLKVKIEQSRFVIEIDQ